jgi:hypothetical protein
MRRIEVLVEEPSAEAALQVLLPRIVQGHARIKIINLGSKYALLKKLEGRLRGYADRLQDGENLRVLVLVDRDQDDCTALKAQMERAARVAGLVTKSAARGGSPFTVVTRIAIEELESWFLGDPDALRKTFPRLPQINLDASPFRNPENGGSWEALHKFLKKHGYYPGTYPKIEAARRIATNMTTSANKTSSFRAFREGLEACL